MICHKFRLYIEKSARRCMVSCGHRFLHRPSRRRDDRTSSTRPRSFHAKKRETVHGVLWTPFFAPTESETRRSNFEHKTSLVSCKKSARRCMVSCGHRFLHRPSRRRDDRTSSTGLCSFHAKRDILSDIPLHEKSARRGSNPRPPPWQGGAPPLSHSRMS